MGNCFRTPEKPYKHKTWKNAVDELNESSYILEQEKVVAMKKLKGGIGYPFKTDKRRFIKIIMKNRKKTAWRVMMNLRKLSREFKDSEYLVLPDAVHEMKFSIHFYYPLCDQDLVWYLNNNEITPNNREGLMLKIMHAVKHLHDKGFVHRDIKLENIVLRNGTPVLCDLDFCTSANEYDYKGTYDYMPPAMCRNVLYDKRKDIDLVFKNKWMDCYALGKSIAFILSIRNLNNENVRLIWEKWLKTQKTSIRAFTVNTDDLYACSKWWKVVDWFCRENEEAVFGKKKIYFWSVNKALNLI